MDNEKLNNIFYNGLDIAGHLGGVVNTKKEITNTVSFYADNSEVLTQVMYADEFKQRTGVGSILFKFPFNDLRNNHDILLNINGNLKINPKYIYAYLPISEGKVQNMIENPNYYNYRPINVQTQNQQYFEVNNSLVMSNHQDYEKGARIIITEDIDSLRFQNDGSFYEGDYKQYITGEKTPKSYRNPALVKAMVNIKMIDTQGYGIHKMFQSQKNRFLPMPDYDRSTNAEVVLTLPGTVIDENYSLLLLANQDLSLTDAVLLDQVQKGHPITSDAVSMLRKRKLIEGRLPHIFVSKNIAQATDQKVEYSKHKGLAVKKCEALLLESLKDHGSLTKQEIVELLWDVLPNQLSDSQKASKIHNMLTKLKGENKIINETHGKSSLWKLA